MKKLIRLAALAAFTLFLAGCLGQRGIYRLTIHIQGRGAVEPSGALLTYAEKTAVEIEALPEPGWRFQRWEVD